MTATIDLTIQPVTPEPQRPAVCPAQVNACPLAPRADDDSDDGCKHPSGSCKPEGCSAC